MSMKTKNEGFTPKEVTIEILFWDEEEGFYKEEVDIETSQDYPTPESILNEGVLQGDLVIVSLKSSDADIINATIKGVRLPMKISKFVAFTESYTAREARREFLVILRDMGIIKEYELKAFSPEYVDFRLIIKAIKASQRQQKTELEGYKQAYKDAIQKLDLARQIELFKV